MIREFEIDSSLAPNDAIVALLRCVGPPRRIRVIAFRKPKHEFEGEVNHDGFKIMRVSRLVQNNHTVISGNFSPTRTGTSISILVRPAVWSRAIIAIFALTSVLVAVGTLVAKAPNESSGWFSLFGFIEALLITVILVALSAGYLGALGRRETRKVLPILEEIFEAHAVAKRTDQDRRKGSAKGFRDYLLRDARPFRVPLLWVAEALGFIAVVVGIGFLIVFFRPPKTSVMGPGQIDSRFFGIGVPLIIIGVVIARDAIDRLRFPPN